MPRYKNVTVEIDGPDGKKIKKGYLVPVDDAAKANRTAIQEAIDDGIYKPAKGEEPEVMAKKLYEKMIAAAKKGIGLPQ